MRGISLIWGALLSGLLLYSTAWGTPAAANCTPPVKITKYQMQKGEFPAAVLRKFSLVPVFGKSGTMNAFLKANNLKDANKIEPGTLVNIPFKCEQTVAMYKLSSDNPEFRVITDVRLPLKNIVSPTAPVSGAAPVDQFAQIIAKPALESEHPLDVEATQANSQDNISEALRYRMICEGEWTGSECITRYSSIFATGGGYNNRYDGVDSNAVPGAQREGLLLSKLNVAAGLGWNNYWNENVKTILYLELQNNQMLPDIKSIPIEGGDRLLTSLSAEARYEKGAWGVGLGFRQFDKLYYVFNFANLLNGSICTVSDISRCGVIVYSANVSSFFADISYMIHQRGKFRFDTELKYFILQPTQVSDVEVGAGSGQSIEFSITHDRVEEYLKGTLRYAQSTQDTSIETQNAKELALLFTYSWKLKDWKEAPTAPQSGSAP
jgi:hypothetical protein